MKTEQIETLQEILFDRIPKPHDFEDRLWEAADNLRANAQLKSSEYAAPLLGLFFLRYASNRFDSVTEQALKEFEEKKDSRNSETIEEIYKRLCGFYVPEEAHYETLLNLTDADNAQQSVIDAMAAFEKQNPDAGVTLPQNDYRKIPNKPLRDIIGKVSEIKVAEGDIFGKIYEYFLGKFALSEGQKGGEFYTPTSVVKLIVEVIEPFKADARVFDPACGTGGMFVQSAKFVTRHVGMQQLSIYGQEQVKETSNLCKLNLFVNGLKGDIQNVPSSFNASVYAGDYADTPGKFDFVMANPPFNVDGVKIEDVAGHELFSTYGLPLSTAKTKKKTDTFSNANYLWASLFATSLNETGRAGFVMANSASDARSGELEIRKKMIEDGLVDVMITIGPNFFYTVTLPVTLWFFDKAKTKPDHPRHDQTLFIDARRIFSPVFGSRTQREFSQSQLLNIASIVWLYRGETEKFKTLREIYSIARNAWETGVFNEQVGIYHEDNDKTYRGTSFHLEALATAFKTLGEKLEAWRNALPEQPVLIDEVTEEESESDEKETNNDFDFQAAVDALKAVQMKSLDHKSVINELYRLADDSVSYAYKVLRPDKDKAFNKSDIRGSLKRLVDDQDDALFVLERVSYFEEQANWLDTNFPNGEWQDIEGLCKIASRAEIEEQNFSLTPGRHVGVAMEDDGMTEAEFRTFMMENAASLGGLHEKADELQKLIAEDLTALFTEIKAEAV